MSDENPRRSSNKGWYPRGRGKGYRGTFSRNQNGNHSSSSLPLVDTQGSQQVITDMLEVSQGPYSGWRLYHKQETEQRKRRSPNWGEAETQLLLRLWAERITEMKTIKRNGFMLEEMAQMLQVNGFTRSSAEVKTRIANLSQEYRMELRKRSLGFPHGGFKLWESVHAILGADEAASNLSPMDSNFYMGEGLQNDQSNTQGGGDSTESLCCAIDPGVLMGHQDNGNEEELEDEYDEDVKDEDIGGQFQENHLPSPIPNLPNIPPSLTISLTSAPAHNGNTSAATPSRMPALIRVTSKRSSIDSSLKDQKPEKRPRLSVDSAITQINVEDLFKHSEEKAHDPWDIVIEKLKENNHNAETRAQNLTQLMEQQIKLQRQGLKIQKKILALLEGMQPTETATKDPTNFKEGTATVLKVQAAEAFISSHQQLWKMHEVEENRAFSLELRTLKGDVAFNAAWPDFIQDLVDNPEMALACLGLGMHQTLVHHLQAECSRHLGPGEEQSLSVIEPSVVRARILGHEPITQIKHLKANFYGKLVTVKGTVIRVGGLKLLCTWLAFSCNTCGGVQAVRQPEGHFCPPSRCITAGCRAKSFSPLHSNHLTQTTNWQNISLQEIVDDDQREGGRVPRILSVELMEDLVESCTPGDEVVVTGVVKILGADETSKKKAASGPSIFQLYVEAVSLSSTKNQAGQSSTGDVKFDVQDYYAIREIHSEPELFRLLVASMCPAIYGHEMVKAGLLLALFGGSPRTHGSGRGDIHVLVVGDPGLGKSQMLQAVTSVAPRGVYVCGNTSSAAGLTVTLTRESGGNFALEAGALVLADQGCCCIDEFDKMSSQHQALLESMEQQSVSVAKAGVVCSLPARASVLAAANPVGGHYNQAKTVSENLRLGPALLSRFDLVFILLDQPNEVLDSLLSEHIIALHTGKAQQPQRGLADSMLSSFTTDQPLSERLKVRAGESLDLIPTELLHKYVAYARKYVQPKLSEGAAVVLQRFYLRLRAQRGNQDCTPITTRQLESLIRLTEARAKLELREEATEDDARDVVELMKHSLLDTFCDELGALDFQRSQNGSGTSTRNQAKKYIALLQRRAELQAKSVFTMSELREVATLGRINIPDFANFVATLNLQGFLLKKGTNLYQLLSADG